MPATPTLEIQGMMHGRTPELIRVSDMQEHPTGPNPLDTPDTDRHLTMEDTSDTAERKGMRMVDMDMNVLLKKKISLIRKLKKKKKEERDYNFMCLSCAA